MGSFGLFLRTKKKEKNRIDSVPFKRVLLHYRHTLKHEFIIKEALIIFNNYG